MTKSNGTTPSPKYGKLLVGILICLCILTAFYPFLPAVAPLTFLGIILSPFWAIIQRITIFIVNYTAFDIWLARGFAVSIYALLSFFLVGYIGNLVGSYKFLLRKGRRLLFLGLWWGVCILMFFVSKNVNFTQSGEPLKTYYETSEGDIELFPIDMKIHPRTGEPLKVVTREVIQDLDLANSEMKKVDITLAKIKDGEIQFFRPSGSPRLWYYKTEKGEFELFTRKGHHPITGDNLKPVTREVAWEIQSSLQAKATQREFDSTLAKAKAAEHAKQMNDQKERSEREEYIKKYIAQSTIPTKTAKIAVLVVDDGGHPNSTSTQLIRSFFQDRGFESTASLFTESFVSDNLFKEVFSGSSGQVRKLELTKYASHILLGKQSTTFSNNPDLQDLVTANVSLELHFVSSESGLIEDSFLSTKTGAGFNKANAEQDALKKVLAELGKRETRLKN